VSVSLTEVVTPELELLWRHAQKELLAKRGGVALWATLNDANPDGTLLANAVTSGSLWTFVEDGEIKGFCLCRSGVVEAVYVGHAYRRHKVATALVRTLLDGENAPVDAYALPGDRGLKSLYESLGWKARLLTMRGA
jgi:GNAT superfamily N-acetyltransferase